MKRENLVIKCDGKTYKGDIEKWYGNPKKINNTLMVRMIV